MNRKKFYYPFFDCSIMDSSIMRSEFCGALITIREEKKANKKYCIYINILKT